MNHSLFPLGMTCTHEDGWLDLPAAIIHREQVHADCLSCQAEIMLARLIMEEAEASINRSLRGRKPKSLIAHGNQKGTSSA